MANGFLTNSDRRAKHNIESLNSKDCLDVCTKLKPVSYVWNDYRKSQGEPSIGFIAQEVQEASPRLCAVSPNWITFEKPITYSCLQIAERIIRLTYEKNDHNSAVPDPDTYKLTDGTQVEFFLIKRDDATDVRTVKGTISGPVDEYRDLVVTLEESSSPLVTQKYVWGWSGYYADDHKEIRSQEMQAVMVGAIKQLHAENQTLAERLDRLEELILAMNK